MITGKCLFGFVTLREPMFSIGGSLCFSAATGALAAPSRHCGSSAVFATAKARASFGTGQESRAIGPSRSLSGATPVARKASRISGEIVGLDGMPSPTIDRVARRLITLDWWTKP